MINLRFFIAGWPYAKQSARFGKTGHVYQTKNIKEWKKEIVRIAKKFYVDAPVDIPLTVRCDFLVRRDLADVDNLAKAILDGLQGTIFVNDKKVVDLRSRKKVSKEKMGVWVTITDQVEEWEG